MPSTLRMKRINDRFKQVLSLTILAKMDDPRLAGVNVTDVKVDRELDYANIYVSSLAGKESSRDVLAALNHARGFLKRELANEIDLRLMPKLRFFWDPTPEKAARIDDLLNQIRPELDRVNADEAKETTEESEDDWDDDDEWEGEDSDEWEGDEDDYDMLDTSEGS